jgi:hypothetical protein
MSTKKWVRSTTGGDYHIPTVSNETFEKNLRVPFDKYEPIPVGWEGNRWLVEAIDKGIIEVVESETKPDSVELPSNLDGADRQYLMALLYGQAKEDQRRAYLDQFRDWRSGNLAFRDHLRQSTLRERVRPILASFIELEPRMQNRGDLISEARKTIEFIEKEAWRDTHTT